MPVYLKFINLELDLQYIGVSPWKSVYQYFFSYFEDLRFICVFLLQTVKFICVRFSSLGSVSQTLSDFSLVAWIDCTASSCTLELLRWYISMLQIHPNR